MRTGEPLRQVGAIPRASYLGGGDIGAILGVSPWATAADVYFRKIGDERNVKIDPIRERIYKRGKRLEPVVIEMGRDELGLDIVKVSPPEKPNRYADAEFPFLAAEIDFEWRVREEDVARFPWAAGLEVGSIQNGEVKTANPFRPQEWGEMDTDEVPIHYAFQSVHGLGVTRRDVCLYLTLFGADNLVTYYVGRDEETIRDTRKQAVAFWTNHVLKRVPPAPRTLEDVQRMYLKSTATQITATEEVLVHVADLADVKAQLKALEERERNLKFQIENFMGHDEVLIDASGRPLATWKPTTYSHLNGDALKERHPEIHAEFYESRPTRRLMLKGTKK